MAIKLHRDLAANVLNGLIIILLVIGAIVFWGQHQFQTEGPTSAPVIVEINPNDKLITTSRAVGVADRLAEQGVIRYPWIFRLGARYLRVESDLKIGEYEIPAGASMKQVLNIINSGVGVTRNVTFPEGFSVFQIIARLNGVADLTGEVGDVPPEGSLAPNTYSYRKGESRTDVIARMARAQTDLLDELWDARTPDLPLKTKQEALVLASIVEKETGVGAERGVVASVFINRLRKGMRLQTDPTVIYGLTGGEKPLGRGLYRSELQKATPYNTYLIDGLPPTPIANPGVAALAAVLMPDETDYIYFVANGEGGHAFAKTLEEHNRNVAKWRAIERSRQ